MLLSKREKKYNLIYIISLIFTVISFYLNILSGYKFILACGLSLCLLFILSLMHYNTFNHALKVIVTTLYFIFIIWMISNKIYFSFFGDYINLNRIFSAAAPSIITSAVINFLKNYSVLILLVSSIINLITFKKAKFRYKKYHKIILVLYILYFALTLGFKTYHYEILSCIATSSFNTSYDEDVYKPITSERENVFDKLINKVHADNEYTGVAKGRSLILVQCESMQNLFTNKTYNNGEKEYEITPTVNKLITNDTLYFNNCFAQIGWGNTSDAEFIVNNSFYPLAMQSIYQRCENNYFYGLPKILQDNGYKTTVFHGYLKEMWNRDKFYPAEGFTNYLSQKDFPTDQFIGFGIADRDFFKQVATKIKNNKSDKLDFNFVITLSSHTPFSTSPAMSDIELKESDKDSTFGNYLININYLDSAIDIFINELKKQGLYDNSIIVFYGDHHGMNRSDSDNYKKCSTFLGKPYQYDDMLNIPFLVHIPGLGKSETIETTCGQMDIMPTLLNILGIENNTVYFGEDVINIDKDSDRAIGGGTYMPTGSFINKDYIFIASDDNIYEHATIIDRKTGGNATDIISKDSLYKKSIELQSDVKLSNTITEKNLLSALLNNDTIILNDVNPQKFIYKLNSDKDEYNYYDRLNEALENDLSLIAVNIYKEEMNEEIEFYVNNKMNLLNKTTLVDFLNEVKTKENVYVILTNTKDFNEDLFRYLGKSHPDLASLCIPEIYSLSDYTYIKTFNMNKPILCLDNLSCTNEELISFILNNDIFAVKSKSKSFKSEYINLLSKVYNIFSYVDDIKDNGEATYYRNKSVKGYYCDSIETINKVNNSKNKFN